MIGDYDMLTMLNVQVNGRALVVGRKPGGPGLTQRRLVVHSNGSGQETLPVGLHSGAE